MAKWSAWLPDMLAQLPACPSFTAEREVRNAAIQFFEESRAWCALLDVIPVSPDENTIEMASDNPTQETVVRVEAGWYDGNKLDVFTANELDQTTPDWTARTGTPTAIVQLLSGSITLYPIPVIAAGLKLRVSLRPADESTDLPDLLMAKYRRVIRDGAMANLREYPGQPWSAYEMAQVQKNQFESAIATARADAARSFGRARIPSRPTWC